MEPSRSRSKTGRERALIIGISDYPPPIRKLPAVANDVREIAQLLRSDRGEFPAENVRHLIDGEASSRRQGNGQLTLRFHRSQDGQRPATAHDVRSDDRAYRIESLV